MNGSLLLPTSRALVCFHFFQKNSCSVPFMEQEIFQYKKKHKFCRICIASSAGIKVNLDRALKYYFMIPQRKKFEIKKT